MTSRNRSWTPREIKDFLHYQWLGRTTREISGQVGRTVPAINSMRRKLKRLGELGVVDHPHLVELLAVSEAIVLTRTLRTIERRAREDLVEVRQFVRRARWTRKAHLVGPYKRNRMATT
jgi:hypothetical protein